MKFKLLDFFKSNERIEDSYKGLTDLIFFFRKSLKISNNYRFVFIHIDAFMNKLDLSALFEFN